MSRCPNLANGQLVVWVGGLDSGDPPVKDCYLGAPLESPKPPIYH